MTQTLDRQVTGLTEEAIKILRAPVPRHEIKTKNIQGNTIRFTDIQFVEDRLAEADPSFGKDITVNGKAITVHYTVLGVRRGASADIVDVKGYGSPVKNAEAQAAKRAASYFGVARELWDKDEAHDDDEEEAPRKSGGSSGRQSSSPQRQASGGGSKGPSEGQATWLMKAVEKGGFGVPGKIVKGLTGGRAGTASLMIEALKEFKAETEDYEDDTLGYIREALVSYKVKDDQGNILRVGIDRELAKQLPDSDADEDEDEDL